MGLTSEGVHQINELPGLVANALNVEPHLSSEDKMALNQAAQHIKESATGDKSTLSKLRQTLSVFKETVTAIVAKVAVDSTASALTG